MLIRVMFCSINFLVIEVIQVLMFSSRVNSSQCCPFAGKHVRSDSSLQAGPSNEARFCSCLSIFACASLSHQIPSTQAIIGEFLQRRFHRGMFKQQQLKQDRRHGRHDFVPRWPL